MFGSFRNDRVFAAAAVLGSLCTVGVWTHDGAAGAVPTHGPRFAAQAQDCDPPRFNLNAGNGGSWTGTVTGVSFVDGNRYDATFQVASGYEITALCIKTQNGLNVAGDYTLTITPPTASTPPTGFPIVGPAALRITPTAAAGSSAIIHVGFTLQPTPPPPQPIVPTLDCVSTLSDGSHLAHFTYNNPNSTVQHIAVGPDNGFDPEPQYRGQPVDFEPGQHSFAAALTADESSITWTLQGAHVMAASSSTPCAATLRVTKALVPLDGLGADDTFDLKIGPTVYAAGVGDAGTTGDVAVPAGSHTVSEVAAAGTSTDLADYDTSIVCDTTPLTSGTGTSLDVTVPAGGAVACVITNMRKGGPGPGPGNLDLSIVKTASPSVVKVGGIVTWTVSVTNHGPDKATNVVVTDQWESGLKYVKGSLSAPGASCSGKVCTLPELGPGDTATGTFQTKATAVGNPANTATVKADQGETNLDNNTASDDVYVIARPYPAVVPHVDCVEQLAGGDLRAHFGYVNPGSATVVIPLPPPLGNGTHNYFVPAPEYRGQPDQFLPGQTDDAFQVDFTGTLTWHLKKKSVTASASSTKCVGGVLRVDKSLSPTDDPGRFDLQIDGTVQGTGANVGDRGTTGDVSVDAGPHIVSEVGAQGTRLDDYDSEIVCRDAGGSGAVVASGPGTSLTVDVGPADSVACVIANVRKATPEPPIPPIEPPAPGTPTADLAVTKTVAPTTVSNGDHVTATITATNHGPDPATNVVLTVLNEPAATLVSVKPSQGTCSNGTCQLGTLPSGGHATITVVARVTIAGIQADTVLVRGTEADPVPENNVASAIVHVNGPLTPPLLRICANLHVSPRSATVGIPFLLKAHVSNARGTAIAGAPVQIHGIGVNRLGRTGRLGIARFKIKARRAGLLRVRSGVRPVCSARVGVSSRTSIPVTG